ncbi:MAG: hypothetical protein WA854_12455 [Candidatus Binataceae bacterium]|jgi:hypothetical protein
MRTSSIKSRPPLVAALTIVIAIGACAMFAVHLHAADVPPSLDEYQSALDAIVKSRSRQSLQPVFEIGIKSSPEVQAILDTLSAGELAALQKKMPGMQIVRGESDVVRPSADFFKNLARRKGTKADRAFFDLYARTEPDSSPDFPAYVSQAGGAGGCTRFDGPLIVGLYRGWLVFRTQYPGDYTTEAQGELDSMDAELSAGTCACGNQQQVTDGLEAFTKAFPDLPLTTKVRARIDRIKAGASHIRFQCHG